MSTWVESAAKISVTVEAGSPATEIFIIDGSFNLGEQGLDRLETNLSPGLYKIKFKTGSMIEERHQVVEPGSGPMSRMSTTRRSPGSAPSTPNGPLR